MGGQGSTIAMRSNQKQGHNSKPNQIKKLHCTERNDFDQIISVDDHDDQEW